MSAGRIDRRSLLLAAPALAFAPRSRTAPFEVLADRPRQLQTRLSDLGMLITPTEDFFISSHFGAPRWNPRRTLSITGMVERPLSFTVAELRRLPRVTVRAVLQCAGNKGVFFQPPAPGVQWRHGALGQADGAGGRLATLL